MNKYDARTIRLLSVLEALKDRFGDDLTEMASNLERCREHATEVIRNDFNFDAIRLALAPFKKDGEDLIAVVEEALGLHRAGDASVPEAMMQDVQQDAAIAVPLVTGSRHKRGRMTSYVNVPAFAGS